MARQSCQRPKGDGEAGTLAQVLMLILLAADADADYDTYADAHVDDDTYDVAFKASHKEVENYPQ